MSSATPVHIAATRSLLGESPEGAVTTPVGALSPRQQYLDGLWRYFRASRYDGWAYDWNGHPALDPTEHDTVAHSGAVPQGFEDPSGSSADIPLKFRKPSAPFALGRVVVLRFTGLLFSAKRHPKIVADDPTTEDWLTGFAAATRLWAQLMQVRNFGGAMGAVGMGFKFVHGKPAVEVHDPRWCFPEFMDRDGLVLRRLEIRYQYNEPVRDPESGEVVDQFFWYRRVIDTETDIIWPKVRVDEDGREPHWGKERCLESQHGYGEVPVVWIQNQPVLDDVDGDSDCHGVYDLIDRIDALYSQANKGTLANCDPTLIMSTDAETDGLRKGTGNAIQVEADGKVSYLELVGGGIEKALDLAQRFEEKALVIARCTLDDADKNQAQKTATEVDRNYSSMTEQADILREQYGEHGVKRLLEMVLRAARMLTQTRSEARSDGTTGLVRNTIRLPKRQERDPDTGAITWVERELGQGEQVELRWPDYFSKSEVAISAKVDAAGKAKTFGIVPLKNAMQYIADDFQIENLPEAMAQAKQEAKEALVMPGYGDEGDAAEKVAQRVESGAKSPLPNPTARLLPR